MTSLNIPQCNPVMNVSCATRDALDVAAVHDKLGFDLQRVNDGHPRFPCPPVVVAVIRVPAEESLMA